MIEQLKTDFDNLNIFRKDPCIPEDGIDNQNWKIDFFNNVEIHVQKQVKLKKKQGNIFLTNIKGFLFIILTHSFFEICL